MEATKKKKAYLKPEMSAFEVKTQEFIAGSKVVIEEEELKAALGVEPCFATGTTCGTDPTPGCSFVVSYENGGCKKDHTIEIDGVETIFNPYNSMKQAGFIYGHTYKVEKVENGFFYCTDITPSNSTKI